MIDNKFVTPSAPGAAWPCVSLFNVNITDLSRSDFITSIIAMSKTSIKHKVYYVNINALNIAFSCPRFRHYLGDAELVFNDGYGVSLASRLIGRKLQYRHTVDDWMDDLLTAVNSDSLKIFLLGDEEYVLSKAAELMHIKHPGLQLVGTHHGFFKKSGPENDAVVRKINELSPDILLVGMSVPIQEFWIEENFDRINTRTFVPVGAAFRWYCGIEKRAPKWVTDNGFEWLARLLQHPIKLFRRYVIGNPLLMLRVIKIYWLKLGLPSKCKNPVVPGCRNRCVFPGYKSF